MGLKLNLQEKLILDLQGRNSFDKMKRLLKALIDMFPNQSKRKKKISNEVLRHPLRTIRKNAEEVRAYGGG